MRGKRMRESGQSEVNMTPMLDVVFIMLIFFIVTAVFIREPGVDVVRPASRTATPPAAIAVYVAVSRDDEFWLDGSAVAPDSLRFEIERLHRQSPAGDIMIQADANASNRATLQVMDAAKAAGFQHMLIATDQGRS